MIYTDRIYGNFEIAEPVILDLINSKSLRRLKDIDQAGYFEPFFPGTKRTRFEHSIGVYFLLKKFKSSLEEQIAGLIHDVSHATFSHAVDYVFDEGSQKEQNHQDNIHGSHVKNSEIPEIIKKYGFDVDYILEEENFPLKETKLPDLCADRIDYSLREAFVYKKAEKEKIEKFLGNFKIIDNKWVFDNFQIAKEYAELFKELNDKYWAGLESAAMFGAVGGCMKHALSKGYIVKDDFYTTDSAVLSKITSRLGEDENLKLFWERMNNKIYYFNNPEDYDFHVFCKSRVVDPLCKHDGEIKRVSDIDPDWASIVEKESKPKEYFIKFAQ